MGRMVGRYELVRPLGRGGMAEVFLARRRGPGGVEKRLVLKRIRRERAADPRFMTLFVQEARLSMSLAHKNIVPMFDFGRAGDELFLVMEFVDGQDLGAALERARHREERVDPVIAAFVAMEACQALDYAHRAEHAVIHRDVTPRNVLLSKEGEVKLVDFGVATSETDVGGARKVRGTPAYMSPEQARGDDVDPRSDLFSVGLVLWESLASTRAYAQTDVATLLETAIAGEVPPLPEYVPARLGAIVERATARAADDRYPSARAMQVALDEYLVAERAQGTGRPPPFHELSAWIEALFDDDAPAAASLENTTPDGPVVTFLEDGLDEIARTLAGGATTMRSMAETMVDQASPDADTGSETNRPAGDDTAPTATVAPGTARGWGVIAVVLGIVAIAGFGIAAAITQGGELAPYPDAAPPDASLDARAIPDAAVAASIAPPDAAPIRADARRRSGIKRPAPVDAAPAGTVVVGSNPWARVTVQGRNESCSETPCSLVLPAGTYTLVLVNDQANLRAAKVVAVRAGEEQTVSITLTRP